MIRFRMAVFLLAQWLALSSQYGLAEGRRMVDDEVAALLLNAPAEATGYGPEVTGIDTGQQDLFDAYHENGLVALWMTESGPDSHARALLTAIGTAAEHGLDPQDYHYQHLLSRWQLADGRPSAELDMLITDALISWVNDVNHGRVHTDPEHPNRYINSRDRRTSAAAIVTAFRDHPDPEACLAGLFPRHRHYKGLQAALARYRLLNQRGGWDAMPESKSTLHPGESGPVIPAIRRRLSVTGLYTDMGAESGSQVYDSELVEAVKRFQLYNGLAPDGVIGKQTVAVMGQTVGERIALIEMNLECWRWLDHELGDAYILVDIAGYDVQGVRNDRVEVEMRGIVGKLHHESPVFSDSIKYMEFNPYWNLTPSIARHETVPKLRKNSDYLAKNHMRVFDGWGPAARELNPDTIDCSAVINPGKYKFRQDPGPCNALGRVKFIFPNKYSIYLHDTPNHTLFERAERSFSHGCIRLSEPTELAKWILDVDESDWTGATVDTVLEGYERTVKTLQTPLPVHLTYESAWIDGDGQLRFAPDVYGRDLLLQQALYEGTSDAAALPAELQAGRPELPAP